MVVVQALVAAGIGVTTLPGLSLQAHRRPDVHTTELINYPRQIYAVTYGEPPDPVGFEKSVMPHSCIRG